MFRRFFAQLRKSRVGMDVALFHHAFGNWVQRFWDRSRRRFFEMLWTILVILLVLWLIGLLSNVGGGLIHLLLVVAVIVLVINLVTGRRAV
jgi:Family of unknown function (DUF5670)